MDNQNKHLIVIAGPTAVGKTALAIKLALHFKTEIISADSRQIYKELNIGVAAPTDNELRTVKHHFIKSISVLDYYNAGMFESDVLERLSELFGIYDTVIMAGGSTLYIEAVCHGMDDLPPVNMSLREKINEDYKQYGIEYLQNQLLQLDPLHYQKTDLKNPLRMIKAIEVSVMTGKPYSSLLTYKKKERGFNFIRIGVNMERQQLYNKIDSRVDNMIAEGLVDEVRGLEYARDTNALRTVGYREIFDHLDGHMSLDEAIRKVKINTRHYAKRQITWFSRYKDFQWFNPEEYNLMVDYILSKI